MLATYRGVVLVKSFLPFAADVDLIGALILAIVGLFAFQLLAHLARELTAIVVGIVSGILLPLLLIALLLLIAAMG